MTLPMTAAQQEQWAQEEEKLYQTFWMKIVYVPMNIEVHRLYNTQRATRVIQRETETTILCI